MARLLDGDQEARVLVMRLGSPSKGYANWTLRLLARKAVVEAVRYETARRTLKYGVDWQMNINDARCNLKIGLSKN